MFKALHSVHTGYLCVSHDSENKWWLFPQHYINLKAIVKEMHCVFCELVMAFLNIVYSLNYPVCSLSLHDRKLLMTNDKGGQ